MLRHKRFQFSQHQHGGLCVGEETERQTPATCSVRTGCIAANESTVETADGYDKVDLRISAQGSCVMPQKLKPIEDIIANALAPSRSNFGANERDKVAPQPARQLPPKEKRELWNLSGSFTGADPIR